MKTAQQEKLQMQLEFNKNKVALYDRGRTAIGLVNKTLSGEAVDLQEFSLQLGRQVVQGNEKAKDAWDVLQSILAIAGQKDPSQFFTQEVTFDGVKYKRAEIAVGFAGRVYEVALDVEASELGKSDRNFIVSMGQYRKDADGKYMVENLTPDSLTVSQKGEKLSIDLTSAMNKDDRKATFGDENFSLKLEERIFMAYDHQQKPITVLAGLTESNQNPKFAQLVTAGTGTGKTAMLAGYAKGLGRGIFAVPQKLVTDMQKDASGFLATKPAVLDDKDIPRTPEQLEAILARNPYLVVSHEQLLQMSSVMRGQDIFIDEAHELTLNPDNTVARDKIQQLKEIGENNISVAVTATPTQALYDLYGKEVIDVSLYMAQHDLHSVRRVETLDRKTGRKGHENGAQIVHQTLALALGHEWSLRAGDKGYIDPKLVKGQSDPAAYAYERNRHTGASVQGIIFTDDPKASDKLAASMQQVYDGKYPADNLGRLQRETSGQRSGNKKQNTGDDQAVAANVDLQTEMRQAQKSHLADSINIAVLMKLNPSLKEKNLQKLARSGDLEKEFNKQLMANQSALDIPKALKLLQDERQKLANPDLDAYYDKVRAQIERVGQNPNSAASLAIKPEEIKPQELGAKYLVVLRKNTTEQSLENTKQLLDRGLIEKVISEGPLGTGYSNSNVLSTIVVQTHDLVPGKTIERNQQLGRPIRDDDRRGFAGTVIDANVDHRVEFATEVYSRKANTHYQQGIAKEGILQKQEELRKEQETSLAQRKEASKQRFDEASKKRGGRSYADVAKSVKAKPVSQEMQIK